MFPGVNPKQLQRLMQQMGIKQEEIPAQEVIIKTSDKEIIITNPAVSKVTMSGQDSFQITGQIQEKPLKEEISEDDIKTVMDQAKVNYEIAKKALEESKGDLAEAILFLGK